MFWAPQAELEARAVGASYLRALAAKIHAVGMAVARLDCAVAADTLRPVALHGAHSRVPGPHPLGHWRLPGAPTPAQLDGSTTVHSSLQPARLACREML